LLLGSHLTDANQDELIAAAAGRSKREIEQFLADRAPKPDAPTRIRPVTRRRSAARPSPEGHPAAPAGSAGPGGLFRDRQGDDASAQPEAAPERDGQCAPRPASPQEGGGRGRVDPLGDRRYKVQFMASADLVAQIQLAANLLSHRMPVDDLAVVVEEAVNQLCERLMKERYGAPRKAGKSKTSTGPGAGGRSPRRAPTQDPAPAERAPEERPPAKAPSRHVPMAIRREVYDRDGHRCTFVDPDTGRRCSETRYLELHHIREWGRHHSHDPEFITIRCRVHNDLAARLDYGEEHMRQYKTDGRPPTLTPTG
jgi:hypothetical protein